MDALEYLKTKKEMCSAVNERCEDCPLLDCDSIEQYHLKRAVEIVKKWKEENADTFLNKLRKALPNARECVIDDIKKQFCPWTVFANIKNTTDCIDDCEACWNSLMPDD